MDKEILYKLNDPKTDKLLMARHGELITELAYENGLTTDYVDKALKHLKECFDNTYIEMILMEADIVEGALND